MQTQLWLIDLAACAAPLQGAWQRLGVLRPHDEGKSAGGPRTGICRDLTPDSRWARDRRPPSVEASGVAPPASKRSLGHDVCRAALRLLLLLRMDARAALAPFERTALGRPFLPGCGLDFNISHSGGVGLLGLVDEGRIGVDVEVKRTLRLAGDRGRRIERAAEQAGGPLAGETADERTLLAWVRLEAMAKHSGRGIAEVLGRIGRDAPFETPSGWTRADAEPVVVLNIAFDGWGGIVAACAIDRPLRAADIEQRVFPTTTSDILDLLAARFDHNHVSPQSAIGCVVS